MILIIARLWMFKKIHIFINLAKRVESGERFIQLLLTFVSFHIFCALSGFFQI